MKKILSLIQYVFIAISALTIVLFAVGATDVDLMLQWMYFLLGAAIAVTILLPLYNLAKNPQAAFRSLIGLAILVVVLGISFAMSSDDQIVNSAGGFFNNSMELKLSDTGLYATYIAMAAAIVTVLGGEIMNSFK